MFVDMFDKLFHCLSDYVQLKVSTLPTTLQRISDSRCIFSKQFKVLIHLHTMAGRHSCCALIDSWEISGDQREGFTRAEQLVLCVTGGYFKSNGLHTTYYLYLSYSIME